MIDIVELQNIAKNLRAWARQIRRDNETASYATSGEDSGLLESAADAMERAADAIERLRKKT
jgi:hypothetical protein